MQPSRPPSQPNTDQMVLKNSIEMWNNTLTVAPRKITVLLFQFTVQFKMRIIPEEGS